MEISDQLKITCQVTGLLIHPRIYWMSAKKINEAILYNSFLFAVVPFFSAEEEIQNRIVKRFKWILSAKILSHDAGEKAIFFYVSLTFLTCWNGFISCIFDFKMYIFFIPVFYNKWRKKEGKINTYWLVSFLTLHTDRSRQQTQSDYCRRYFQSTKCFTYLEKKRNKNDWKCEI